MDIDLLVMTAYSKYGVQATVATTFSGAVAGAQFSAITFVTADDGETFAAACMGDGIAAKHYGLHDGEYTVLVMH